MECIICGQEICQDDLILKVIQARFNGPREDDITYQLGSDKMDGIVHLECIESSAGVARTTKTAVVASVVTRSNALSLIDQ